MSTRASLLSWSPCSHEPPLYSFLHIPPGPCRGPCRASLPPARRASQLEGTPSEVAAVTATTESAMLPEATRFVVMCVLLSCTSCSLEGFPLMHSCATQRGSSDKLSAGVPPSPISPLSGCLASTFPLSPLPPPLQAAPPLPRGGGTNGADGVTIDQHQVCALCPSSRSTSCFRYRPRSIPPPPLLPLPFRVPCPPPPPPPSPLPIPPALSALTSSPISMLIPYSPLLPPLQYARSLPGVFWVGGIRTRRCKQESAVCL